MTRESPNLCEYGYELSVYPPLHFPIRLRYRIRPFKYNVKHRACYESYHLPGIEYKRIYEKVLSVCVATLSINIETIK